MPRTALTVTDAPQKWSATGAAVTMAAADVANKNTFVASNDQLVICHNSGASSRTVTIDSEPLAEYNREQDVAAQSIAAGVIRVFRLVKNGWADSAGKINLEANHADVKFGVLDLTKAV